MVEEVETEPPPTPTRASRYLPFVTAAPFYGWWVLGSFIGLRMIASGVGNNVRSLLVLPLEDEFGSSRAAISLMATAGSISVALTAPLGGWLMDRFGPRRVMLVTLLVAAGGYVALSQAQALWQVIVMFALPLGVAYNWAILNSGAPILNNWFDRQKARALSLLNVGHGAGALLLPLMALAIVDLGWRTAILAGGVVLLVAGLITVFVIRDTPEEMGLTPDGDAKAEDDAPYSGHNQTAGTTLKEAVRTPFFWAIGLGSACMLFINSSVIFHMVPLMESRGEGESLGALLLSLQLLLTVPIVLASAWAADKVGGTRVLTGMMVFASLGVLVLLVAETRWVYVPAVALLAFGGSHWAILWAVLGRVYGRLHYNSIRMSIYSILIAGMSGAPVLAGLSFDIHDSYTPWLRILIAISAIGIVAFVVTDRAAKASRITSAAN